MAGTNTQSQTQESEVVDYSSTTFGTINNTPAPAGVHTWLLALELSNQENRGRFRWRLADKFIDPVSGLWAKKPLTREQQRKLPTWHCDQLGGEGFCFHADPDTFFLAVRAEIDLWLNTKGLVQCDFDPPSDKELKVLWDYQPESTNEKFQQLPGIRYDYNKIPKDSRHWRLCADKQACAFRVRDERESRAGKPLTETLWEVKDYRGLLRGSRLNPMETHIFHDGPVKAKDDILWLL